MRHAIFILALAILGGCSSYGGAGTAASTSAGSSTTMLGAAGLVALVAIDYFSDPAGPPPSIETQLLGRSRAMMDMCVASDRQSELLPRGRETWTYARDRCEFSLDFEQGWVSDVRFASRPDACNRVLDRCLR